MCTKICYLVSNVPDYDEEDREERKETEHKSKDVDTHRHEIDITFSKKGKKNVEDECFYKYIAKYGHHFNEKLAKEIVDKFVGVEPKITFNKVEEILKQWDDDLDYNNTISDLYVLANEIRATHSTTTVKSDVHAVSLAAENLNSPNKEEGDLFLDWVDILKRRGEKIDWKEYL